eukprot:COSAG03_NODE_8248_length_821_cov_0.811634_2_plen_75_part_01
MPIAICLLLGAQWKAKQCAVKSAAAHVTTETWHVEGIEADLAKLGPTLTSVGIVEYEATVALTALCSCIDELDLD